MRPDTIKKTGSMITLGGVAGRKPLGMTVYGNTRQNLWVNPRTYTISGVTLNSNNDGSMTISGTSTAPVAINKENIVILKPSTTYTLSVDKQTPSGARFRIGVNYNEGTYVEADAAVDGYTFKTPSVVYRAVFQLSVDSGVTVSGTYRVMLNEGSEPEPWCPPGINGVEDLALVTAGKNLAIVEKLGTGPYDYNQLISTSLPEGRYTISGILRSGTNVNIKDGSSNGPVIKFVDSLPTTINVKNGQSLFANAYNSGEYDATANIISNLQIELGSTATPYEPPAVTTTPVDLDGHALNSLPDGTRDELCIDGTGAVTLVQRIGVVDKNTDWVLGTQATGTVRSNIADALFELDAQGDFLAQGFKAEESSSVVANWIDYSAGIAAPSAGQSQVYVKTVAENDLAASKQIISDLDGKFLYALATPQEIELPPVTMPKLPEGDASVWAESPVPAEIEIEAFRYSPYGDGFEISGTHVFYSDFGQCIASRNIGAPEKKLITKTVPHMSGFFDFSKVYGALAYESRELEYEIQMIGDSREDLQQQRSDLMTWLSTIHDEDIYDEDVPGWHFHGSLESTDWEEGESGESGTLTVTFICHPFMIRDEESSQTIAVGSGVIENEGMAVNPYASVASGTGTIKIGNVTQSVGTSPVRLTAQLQPGSNQVEVTGASVTVTWHEERV